MDVMPKLGAIRDGRKWNGKRWVPIAPPKTPSTRVVNRRGRVISNTPVPSETPDTNPPVNPPGPPVPLITPRVADPLETTLAGAYESLGPRAVGDMTWGRILGQPNNTGFIEPTEEMLNETASIWKSGMGIEPSSTYTKSIYETNPDMYNSSEISPTVGFNDVDLNTGLYNTVLPSSQPKTGLQALRADEKSKGLLYASGKYWSENADGKLEAIPTDLINGEGSARQQAIAFMENKRGNVIEAQKEAPPRDEPLWGDTPTPLDKTGPTPTPTQTTPQLPSIPFGDIPAGLQGLQLPGGIYDTGESIAEKIGGEIGRRKAMEKGGNWPVIGPWIQNRGEQLGMERGRELFNQYAEPFEQYFDR